MSLFIATHLNRFKMEPFEHESDVSFKSGKQTSGSKAFLIILSVTSLILLVISIVFISLYTLEKSKKTSTPQIPREQKYCGSKACFDTAKGRMKCISCKHSRTPAQHFIDAFFSRNLLPKKIVMSDWHYAIISPMLLFYWVPSARTGEIYHFLIYKGIFLTFFVCFFALFNLEKLGIFMN